MSDDRIRHNSEPGGGNSVPPRWSILVVMPIVLLAALTLYLTANGRDTSAELLELSSPTVDVDQVPVTSTAAPPTDTTLVESGIPHCEAATEGVVEEFLAATSEGDASAAEALFATEAFVGFTEPPHRIGDEARSRVTLWSYFTERFADGFRLSLETQQYHGGAGDHQAGFGFLAHNEDGRAISGIGRIYCDTDKIALVVLSLPSYDFDYSQGDE